MVLRRTSDQYLATCKVSTQSINMVKRYRLIKTITKNLNTKFIRSEGHPGWVMMVLRKTSDQYLATCKVSTQSMNMVKRYRLTKTLTKKNFNQKLKHKISKSVTLTSRSPRVGHDGTA